MKSTTEPKALLRSENNDRTRVGRGPQMLRLGVTLALMLATVALAQNYRVLKSFNGSDGSGPLAGLVVAGRTLYGTTVYGGSSGYGVVFKVNTDGSGYTVLKNFDGSDGSGPWGGMVLAGSTLYGTTSGRGYGGYGTVFKLNTDGTGYAVLRNFNGNDGAFPYPSLVLAGSTLYGTTQQGGDWSCPSYPNGAGVVFKVNTDGSGYTVLKNCTGSDGMAPVEGLVLAGNTLYGTTFNGGISYSSNSWGGYGVVFKVNTDGSDYAVLQNFIGTNGGNPQGSLVLAGGTLYGTTQQGGSSYGGGSQGCGVVFRVNTDGSGYTVLKNFSALTSSDEYSPQGSLALVGGRLYGTTFWGGSSNCGVIYRLNTDGSGYAVVRNFALNDGGFPQAGLFFGEGMLYGATESSASGHGVIFSLGPVTPPSITMSPSTQTAEAGTAPWFSVGVTNTLPEATAYQWYFNSNTRLSSATNAFLRLTNIQPVQAGAYTVVVTNLLGAVTSAPALLSVIPPVEKRVVPALHLAGGTGSLLHLEYADSLGVPQWFSLSDVTLSGGPQLCFDSSQPLPAQRFYRAWQTNGPPPALDATMATEIPLTGAIGSSVRVDYINQFGPTDAWVTLDTVTLTNTTQLYYDLTAFGQPTRLYRLVAVP